MESDVPWKWSYLLSSQKTDEINTNLSHLSLFSIFSLKMHLRSFLLIILIFIRL